MDRETQFLQTVRISGQLINKKDTHVKEQQVGVKQRSNRTRRSPQRLYFFGGFPFPRLASQNRIRLRRGISVVASSGVGRVS